MSSVINQEVAFPASPQPVYEALMDSKQFSDMTSAPADIGCGAGAAFSCFGGMITGRHLELLPNQRIVQAWRVGNWDAGVYSIVGFELKAQVAETFLIFRHTGFPVEHFEHLASGWQKMYWDNLQKYLA
jgi:activator of HSP90 ATPase